MEFLNFLFKLLPKQNSFLEEYINSKNPTSITEVEYWTREYYNEQIKL
jgi:hypothetical protein